MRHLSEMQYTFSIGTKSNSTKLLDPDYTYHLAALLLELLDSVPSLDNTTTPTPSYGGPSIQHALYDMAPSSPGIPKHYGPW